MSFRPLPLLLIGLMATALAGTALAQTPAPAPVQNQPPAAVEAPADPLKIEGFRTAKWGMTDPQVRQAIRKDFPAVAERIATEVDPNNKTTSLVVQVNDLLPSSGRARIAYVLGFNSKKLMSVTVTWTADPKVAGAAEGMLSTANLLSNYFQTAGLPADKVKVNQQLQNGLVVVFVGADAEGRQVQLVLAGAQKPGETKPETPPQPLTLQLSYFADPNNPDIYRIPKGQF